MATVISRVPDPEVSEDPLDSYSATVIRVAAAVTPHVAALEVSGTGRQGRFRVGAGSAVLFTPDGYLLTNPHAVCRAGAAARCIPTGPAPLWKWSARIHSPIWQSYSAGPRL